MQAPRSRRCYYEVVGVELDASEDDIKSAFRKAARLLHPDKNRGNEEEATAQFQELQNAYAVLSDPQERAWYDSHREAILRGGDGTAGESDWINLWELHMASAYSAFDDSPKGFFTVYDKAFFNIDLEDDENDAEAPRFGRSDASVDVVEKFYAHWTEYVPCRSFGHVDKYNLLHAENRQVARLMEKENKKLRDEARKKYMNEVRALVRFVKNRDPRLERVRETRALEKTQREQAAAEAAARQRERHQKEMEALRARAREQYGEPAVDDESDDEPVVDELDDELYCIVCDVQCRNEKHLAHHKTTKKHQQKLKALVAEVTLSDSDDDVDDSDAEADADDHDDDADADPGADQLDVDDDDADDEDDDDDDEAPPPPAKPSRGKAVAKPAPAPAKKTGKAAATSGGKSASVAAAMAALTVSDNDDDDDDDDDGARASDAPAPPASATAKAAKPKKRRRAVKGSAAAAAAAATVTPSSESSAAAAASSVAAADPVAADAVGPGGEVHRCNVCPATFSTRNKLFDHIKKTGHAKHVSPPKGRPAAKGAKGRHDSDDDDDAGGRGGRRRGKGRK